MYQKILLCYDGTIEGRRALRQGADVAIAMNSHAYLLAICRDLVSSTVPEGVTPELVSCEQSTAQALLNEILERARNLMCPVPLVRGEQELHVVDVSPCLAQHQVAADPGPNPIEGSTRDASEMLTLRHVIHQERLDRGEEQPLRVPDARKPASLLARRLAQLLQDHRCAGRRLPAQGRAFEL